MRRKISIIFSFVVLMGVSCAQGDADKNVPQTKRVESQQTADSSQYIDPKTEPKPEIEWDIVREIDHATNAYTQGLFYEGGYLYESTGQNGASSVRKLDAKTGEILKKTDVDAKYFAEGITLLDKKIYQLTWITNTGFIYDFLSLKQIGTFEYFGQGWGLCTNGKYLIMSDGTNALRFLDPKTFRTDRTIMVIDEEGMPLRSINELEYINDEIWANVYMHNYIVVINPEDGKVKRSIDLSSLESKITIGPETDVLNGIAYDKKRDEFYFTGKNWNKIFVVKFK